MEEMGYSEASIRHIALSFDEFQTTWKNNALMKILKIFCMKASLKGGIRDPSNYICAAFNNINWADEDAQGWGKGRG